MADVQGLVAAARKAGFTLTLVPGEQPKWSPIYPAARMPDKLLAELRAARDEVVRWMTQPRRAADVSAEWEGECERCNGIVTRAVFAVGCSGLCGDGSFVVCPYAPKKSR